METKSDFVKPRPNLFRCGTTELTQDAMLGWLISWADPEHASKDPQLHRLGNELLQLLFRECDLALPEIRSVDVIFQFHGIDLLIQVNNEWQVVIEDKVGSTEHSDQLSRYIRVVKEKIGVGIEQIVPIYLQTGDQGSYDAVHSSGFKKILRRDLLKWLEPHVRDENVNAIVNDWYQHLHDREREVASFVAKPIHEWNSSAWIGFFCEVQNRLEQGNWGYVSNPAGGFMGFWWGKGDHVDVDLYCQLEEHKLVWKIGAKREGNFATLRNIWSERVIRIAKEFELKAIRPSRFGNGWTMTVAVLDGDYRENEEGGVIDLDQVLSTLTKANQVIARCIAETENSPL